MGDGNTRATRRTAQTDPEATPLMDAARRRSGQQAAADIRAGRAPIPDSLPSPGPDLVSVPVDALQEMKEVLLERIRLGEDQLRGEFARLLSVKETKTESVEARALALKLARGHVRRLPVHMCTPQETLGLELRVASWLLAERYAGVSVGS